MALARDANFYPIPLLDEGPEKATYPSIADSTETGFTYGTGLPGSYDPDGFGSIPIGKRIVTFEGLSGDEEPFPTASDAMLRRLLNYFHAGGAIRVYRNYPTVVSEWYYDTPHGYDDVVPAEHGSGDYGWFSASSFRRHTFKIEGLVVNAH